MDTYSHVMPTMQNNVIARLDDILDGVSQQQSDGHEHVALDLEGEGYCSQVAVLRRFAVRLAVNGEFLSFIRAPVPAWERA